MLRPSEVTEINELTQIYSGNYVFARTQLPLLTEYFTGGEHLMIKYHRFEWLERIKKVIEVGGW